MTDHIARDKKRYPMELKLVQVEEQPRISVLSKRLKNVLYARKFRRFEGLSLSPTKNAPDGVIPGRLLSFKDLFNPVGTPDDCLEGCTKRMLSRIAEK